MGKGAPGLELGLMPKLILALLLGTFSFPCLGELVVMKGGIETIGEYYIHVELGKPPQKIRVQVDTGSSSLVIKSSSCQSCTNRCVQSSSEE